MSHCTLAFGLCGSFITAAAAVVLLAQFSQPVRVAQPWHSRTVLPRRARLSRRCTLTSWWDRCRRRTLRMRSKGSPTCSWRRRRPGRCRHPPGARTAPLRWGSTTSTAPFIISGRIPGFRGSCTFFSLNVVIMILVACLLCTQFFLLKLFLSYACRTWNTIVCKSLGFSLRSFYLQFKYFKTICFIS